MDSTYRSRPCSSYCCGACGRARGPPASGSLASSLPQAPICSCRAPGTSPPARCRASWRLTSLRSSRDDPDLDPADPRPHGLGDVSDARPRLRLAAQPQSGASCGGGSRSRARRCVLVAVIAPVFVANRPADLIALGLTLMAVTRLPLLPTVLIGIAA